MQLLHDRYAFERELGRTRVARTWLATDTQTDAKCVVKSLSWLDSVVDGGPGVFTLSGSDGDKVIALFERESRILANLEHPRIPTLIDQFTLHDGADKHLYFVQAFVDGTDLGSRLDDGQRFSEDDVVGLLRQACDFLAYLHSQSPPVIHRDIKPSNLILTDDGELHLIDFGAVKDELLHAELGGATVVGTFGYMPPEQYEGRADARSDIYALGMTMILLLSRLEPDTFHREGGVLQFHDAIRVSAGLVTLLESMTRTSADERVGSVSELAAAVERVSRGDVPFLVAKQEPSARRRVGPVGTAVAIVVLLLAVAMWMRPPPHAPAPSVARSPEPPAKPRKAISRELPDLGQVCLLFEQRGLSPLPLSTRPETVKSKASEKRDCVYYNRRERALMSDLMLAIQRRSLDDVRDALDRGADPNEEWIQGIRPLHLSMGRHYAITELLLQRGATHDVATAAGLGKTTILRQLLAAGGDPNAGTAYYCRSPLHLAVINRAEACVRILLDAGAEPDVKDSDGNTPLGWAGQLRRGPVAGWLMEKGADPNNIDELNQTPLYYAASYGNIEMAKELLKRGALVDRGCQHHGSPLHQAARHKRVEIIELLLTHGADINFVQRWTGWRPLHHAVMSGDERTINTLLKSGAQVDVAAAALAGCATLVSEYLEDGGNPNGSLGGGDHLLFFAATAGSVPVIELLLKHGADVDRRASFDRTAAFPAARLGRLDALRTLLEGGADPNMRCTIYRYRTPLAQALNRDDQEMVALLRKHAASQ